MDAILTHTVVAGLGEDYLIKWSRNTRPLVIDYVKAAAVDDVQDQGHEGTVSFGYVIVTAHERAMEYAARWEREEGPDSIDT